MSLPDFGFYVLCATAVVLLAAQAVIHPTEFVQVFIFGLTQGSIYALVALGYTMVYGIIELINFAHGDVFTLGAYIGSAILSFFAISEGGFNTVNLIALLLVFPAVMLIMGGINVAIERVAYRPLRNAPRLAPLIAATFFIGALLAGAGGMIWGLYYNTVYYQLGFRSGLIAFTAAVFGGIGNIPGAALGGLIIGLIAAFSDSYIGSKWTQVVVFGILIGVLVFRPTGLLGMRVPEK